MHIAVGISPLGRAFSPSGRQIMTSAFCAG
jgi:hypothetical protein